MIYLQLGMNFNYSASRWHGQLKAKAQLTADFYLSNAKIFAFGLSEAKFYRVRCPKTNIFVFQRRSSRFKMFNLKDCFFLKESQRLYFCQVKMLSTVWHSG